MFTMYNLTTWNDTENSVMEVTMLFGEEEDRPNLTNWYITYYEEQDMIIQLLFDDPLKVSSSIVFDSLNVTFVQNEFFWSPIEAGFLEEYLELKERIPQQLGQNPLLDLLNDIVDVAKIAMNVVMFGGFAGFIFFGFGLQLLWGWINAL